MTGVRPVRFRPPPAKQWTHAGWGQMYDSRHVGADQEGEAPILVNLHPTDVNRPGTLQLRAGLRRFSTPTTVRTPTNTQWQAVGGFFLGVSSSYKIVVMSGGELYEMDGSTGVLTKRISAANLATAGITLNTTSYAWMVQFARVVVVADGTGNIPFTWDGTANGGLVKLTNAPSNRSTYVCPTVYYGKLFFAKATGPTIVWSEENQPNVGYEAGGYNNAWDLTQTGGGSIFGLLGTNDGLYFWRHQTAGVIRGPATSTFQSDGTLDSISQQTGIMIEVRPAVAGGAIWWVAADGRPMAYRADVGSLDLGTQVVRQFGSIEAEGDPGMLYLGNLGEEYLAAIGGSNSQIVVDRPNGRVHFEFVSTSSSGTARRVLAYDFNTLKLLFVDVYPSANTPALFEGEWAAILPASTLAWPATVRKYVCDANGYMFFEPATPGPGIFGWDETHDGAGVPVVGTLIGPMDGWSTGTEWQFTQIDVITDALPTHSVTARYVTSRFHKASLAPSPQAVADSPSNTPYERRHAFGISTSGRWLRPIIQLAVTASFSNRQPQIHAYTVTGVPLSATPNVT